MERTAARSRLGQCAVITGGAAGIGKASAELWLAAGGSVVVADVDDDAGSAFEASYPGKVKFLHVDTRDRAQVTAAIAMAKSMGRFTCMFCNAGVSAMTDNLDEALPSWDVMKRVIDINVTACALGTYLALDQFDPSEGGSVVITASMAGLLPVGAPPIYSMTKAANVQFVRAVGSALGDVSKKRVYALCPSYTATALGPDPELIRASLGGVLQAKHQAEGFWLLAAGDLPNGSVMRVTARRRGTQVVHDLMCYGKDQGGGEPARPGQVVKTAPLEEWTGPLKRDKESFGNVAVQTAKL